MRETNNSLDMKNKITLILSLLLIIISFSYLIYSLTLYENIYLVFILIGIYIFILPLFCIFSALFLFPLDYFLKNKRIVSAQKKLRNYPNLIIIGITGSYGKTSVKEILYTLLSEKYKVLISDGNKNTPLWISELILEKLNDSYDVFIVEMGAYIPWDIKQLCDLVHPSIWILTGITLQHLERFWNIENIINTKYELIESLPKTWLWVIDISNENAKIWLERRKSSMKKSILDNIITINNIEDFKYIDGCKWLEYTYDNNIIQTALLASHSINAINICYEVAKFLWMDTKSILTGISKILPVVHRMQPIYNPNTDVWVIDDTYNGNFEGFKSGINFLGWISVLWKKIYLTPGIAELWKESNAIHYEIGKKLSKVADLVLLIKNHTTASIMQWLVDNWFLKKNIIIYPNTMTAHDSLWKILDKWDIILFQNDWTDNYF